MASATTQRLCFLQGFQPLKTRKRTFPHSAKSNFQGFGDEAELKGRSHLVLTVVRDTIRSTLPSLLRVFTGVEDPVAFEPISYEITGNDQQAAQLARQATDYARWALFTANAGWQILHDALLDALTRKAGWVRWHWGKLQESRVEVCNNLLLPRLQILLSEPGIETQRIIRRPMTQEELQSVQRTPALRRFFVRHAMGLIGDLPKLIRGERP